ncbi:MAG: hypothetical protein IPH88_17365 [Bacteroidales bacterium]|nr:hypothetical protein [Bacteroidales bacterium]
MNKKLVKYLIATVLLAGIVLFSAWYWYGIFTPYNAYTAKRDISKGNIQILYYGEMNPNQKLVDRIAIQYGFQYKRVDDCTVNGVLINGVKRYNDVVYDYLDRTKGKNWDKEFRHQIEMILNMDR